MYEQRDDCCQDTGELTKSGLLAGYRCTNKETIVARIPRQDTGALTKSELLAGYSCTNKETIVAEIPVHQQIVDCWQGTGVRKKR